MLKVNVLKHLIFYSLKLINFTKGKLHPLLSRSSFIGYIRTEVVQYSSGAGTGPNFQGAPGIIVLGI